MKYEEMFVSADENELDAVSGGYKRGCGPVVCGVPNADDIIDAVWAGLASCKPACGSCAPCKPAYGCGGSHSGC
jgi:hypothetical protein